MAQYLTEEIKEKWQPIVESEGCEKITSKTMRNCLTQVLENTDRELSEVAGNQSGQGVGVAGGTGYAGGSATRGFDPVLIGMIRRVMPSLIANDIVGVQPMTGPTGLIFAKRTFYGAGATGTESNTSTAPNSTFTGPNATATQEGLGEGNQAAVTAAQAAGTAAFTSAVSQTNPWPEMSFRIDKVSIEAQGRALKATYTHELAKDLQAIHGLDAETEIAEMLSTELVAEMNRELIGTLFANAVAGGAQVSTGVAIGGLTVAAGDGVFDMTPTTGDADGRWSVERYKALLVHINKQANQIALDTRRGVGNYIITSANVVGTLDMASKMDTSMVTQNLQFDGVGATFVGVLGGRYKVYVDPYMIGDQVLVGYKGANVYDAGIFFAPYVPLQMYKTVDGDSFNPRIGFKSRYAIASNPFVTAGARNNTFYRHFHIAAL